jgi:hypothetical protein
MTLLRQSGLCTIHEPLRITVERPRPPLPSRWWHGTVARSLYKYENDGEFTVDELIKLIPASLMAGIPNVAPAEEPRDMGS